MSAHRRWVCSFLLVAALGSAAVRTQTRSGASEWRFFGGDKGYKRYSPLDQINRDNVGRLKVLWRRPGIDARFTKPFPELKPSAYFRATPIVVDGVLYAPT